MAAHVPTHDHGDSHDHHHHQAGGQADLLDLDAEILAEHTAAVTEWLPLSTAPRQIVDLGSGTGAGTFALLDRFPDSHVTAVDASVEHLQRLRANACDRGVEDRVHTLQADLDGAAWPDLGTPELVWASASMHHMTNPDLVLRAVHDLLAPGGLFAVIELAGFPLFLPEGPSKDQPSLEERLHAEANRRQTEQMPHRGADWGPMLTAAGFTVEGERTITVNIAGSSNEVIGRYALGGLQRFRTAVADRISAADLAELDQILDTTSPHSILRRDDLVMRSERTVWAARRT
ncbi:class I SAM-dependent methyltransferase [Kribbella sp. CA-293567]|uniref:class I SAM-dependent methyltransferase n=1 Tax=Kribbella sp. CA-293567 TaxID=3002436 RepID=UPI0022DDDE6B|nr:class I SAM-dependent methyltransferase [Kribbella sp. CA-293567]WBQ08389.1 class I SAM-dependent methyltransferase [Kribbella sp. CA-293567]